MVTLSMATYSAITGAAAQEQTDPLDSPNWNEMHRYVLEQAPFVFDDRVKVIAPASAEDVMNVPVKVDASAIDGVQRMIVFADLNPITRIMELEPEAVMPVVSFNFKVQQGTPLRAAVMDREGVWHVGGVYLDAAGGGCTAPSVGSGNSDWAQQLGTVSARLWPTDEGQRMRVRIMHPMDTGLAPRIPVFIIEKLEITDRWGERLALLSLHEPIAENPILTLDLKQRDEVRLFAVDNNGNRFAASVQAAP
jgi:sulfur-oxidizing protein SoxY